nr:unnamed protein product [Digitaria exilis]
MNSSGRWRWSTEKRREGREGAARRAEAAEVAKPNPARILFDQLTYFLLTILEESQRLKKQLSLTLTIGYQLLYLVSSEVRIAGASAYADNLLAAAPVGLLGLLLLFQTTRVRFVFDNEALEVKVGDQLQESGENVFLGGKNHWKYSTLVNWELWWPQFPILVYFKETQTKLEGQIHFFPVIFNGRQLYDVMVERAGPSKTSGPK